MVKKGRLQPGRMFLIDTSQGRIIDDEEIKRDLAAAHPYGEWLRDKLLHLDDLPDVFHITEPSREVIREQQTFGYTHEELRLLIEPMARNGMEALGSMGTDTPLAVLSDRPRLALRLLQAAVRPGHQPAARRHPGGAGHLAVQGHRPGGQPAGAGAGVLPPAGAPAPDHRQRPAWTGSSTSRRPDPRFKARTVRCLYPAFSGGDGLRRALERIRREVSEAIEDGANIIVLSDWLSNEDLAPIPMLLATAAVHHHLIREKTRTQVGLIVETGEAREVHHFACCWATAPRPSTRTWRSTRSSS